MSPSNEWPTLDQETTAGSGDLALLEQIQRYTEAFGRARRLIELSRTLSEVVSEIVPEAYYSGLFLRVADDHHEIQCLGADGTRGMTPIDAPLAQLAVLTATEGSVLQDPLSTEDGVALTDDPQKPAHQALFLPVTAVEGVVAAWGVLALAPGLLTLRCQTLLRTVARLVDVIYRRIGAQKHLEHSQEHWRALVEHALDLITVLDRNGRVTYASASVQRKIGVGPEAWVGAALDELVHPKDREGFDQAFRRLLDRPGEVVAMEFRVRHRSGAWRVLEGVARNLLGDTTVAGVVANLRDVTGRRMAEDALKESEERYALAVRGANDGIWDWDLRKGTLYYSPRWKSLLGYVDSEVIDQPVEWFSRVHPDDKRELQNALQAHIEGSVPHFECEYRMQHRDGGWRWMLSRGLAVRTAEGEAYRIAGSQSDVTVRKQIEEELTQLVFYDKLTELANRPLFLNRLRKRIAASHRQGNAWAVLLFDLDRFNLLNDSLGHAIGDRLLISVAERLRSCVRPGDTVARLGGDEFAILVENTDGPAGALRVAQRVEESLREAFIIGGHEIFTSVSIGIRIGDANPERAEEILRDADVAMYRAKAAGRACYAVFDPDMHAQSMLRLQLEGDLRRALDQGEMHASFQPIVSLRSGRIAGFEALIRWAHPVKGMISPEVFIPIAEETGLIVHLGRFMLREACSWVKQWQERFPSDTPLTVSVNLSAAEFRQRDLVDMVKLALSETAFNPRHLRLEITETVVMENSDEVTAMLEELKDLNIQLHMDDFGTGYSSLSYLRQLPIDVLKIDRSFVMRLGTKDEDMEIVKSIVDLAHNLNISVTAEGVETAEQLEMLRNLGCESAQGYFFAPPRTGREMEALLATAPSW